MLGVLRCDTTTPLSLLNNDTAKSLGALLTGACLVIMFTKLEESCVDTSQQASVSYKSRHRSTFALEGDLRAVSPVLFTHVTDGLNNERGDNRLFTSNKYKLESGEPHHKHLSSYHRNHG
jgi:hypothetical protein